VVAVGVIVGVVVVRVDDKGGSVGVIVVELELELVGVGDADVDGGTLVDDVGLHDPARAAHEA
jgi:hypothetical protein